MKNYTLIVVSDPSSESEFLDFPSRLYKSDPNYIRPLDEEVKAIFDPAKNKLFRNGDARLTAKCFIALNDLAKNMILK
jgi:hypothetical protein